MIYLKEVNEYDIFYQAVLLSFYHLLFRPEDEESNLRNILPLLRNNKEYNKYTRDTNPLTLSRNSCCSSLETGVYHSRYRILPQINQPAYITHGFLYLHYLTRLCIFSEYFLHKYGMRGWTMHEISLKLN